MKSFELSLFLAYNEIMDMKMNFTSFILAAGNGKRMKSSLAKPLHSVGGKAMLSWVIDTATAAGSDKICVVSGTSHSQIDDYMAKHYPHHQIAHQEKPQGTGHAAQIAQNKIAEDNQPILVLFGDSPLITAETLQRLVASINDGCDLTILSFEAEDPTGYGRLKCDEKCSLEAIIEEADASDDDKEISLVNAGVMALSCDVAKTVLYQLENNNAQGEFYLTDLVQLARKDGLNIGYVIADEDEVLGVNSRADLARAEQTLQQRLRHAALANGVTLQAPETVFLHANSVIEADVTIEPHVVIGKNCHIKEGAIIRAFSHIEGAIVGNCAIIGPYARLREGSELAEGVKIGNFVETKKAKFEKGAKANHLSYIGDATVGASANIGAGTITCNYDGYDKFKTEIGKGAFIGSNSALVAPITIGDGAIIGAGSTITKNVESDDLALTRAQQRSLENGAAAFRKRKKS